MSDQNEQLKEALREALHELFLSEDVDHSSGFIEILNNIRSDLNLIMMTDRYVEKYIWEKFRVPTSMQQTLIATTATFLQGVDNIEGAIERLVTRFVPFSAKSQIVDDETISKAVEHTSLLKILQSNYWLFFILYAVTNMRVVVATSLEHVPDGRSKGN